MPNPFPNSHSLLSFFSNSPYSVFSVDMCQCVCACVCMDVVACICVHGDQRESWSAFLRHSQPHCLRQGPSLNLEFTSWTDRLSREAQEANYFYSYQSWACKCISPTIPCFYVVARDTNPCLQSKHFTQRAISSASPCFVNVCSYLLKFKQVCTTIICSNIASSSFLLGSPVLHMLIYPILYFTHKAIFHNLLCLFVLFCFFQSQIYFTIWH